MTGPRVSVVIPCYNAAATLPRALASVAAQGVDGLELVLVDDNSQDGTPGILAAAAAAGAKVVRLPGRSGAAAARNAGVAAAQGTYVAFLDADDEWLPGKLAAQLALLESSPAMTFASCGCRFRGPAGEDWGMLYEGYAPASGREAWRTLLAYNFVATPSVVARRAALLAVGGFDRTLPIGEDQDLWLRLALAGPVGYVGQPLLVVHAQARSLSTEYQDRVLDIGLLLLRRHAWPNRRKLGLRGLAFVLGHRFTKLGRNAVAHRPWVGAGLLLAASLLGREPLTNLLYLAQSVPPGRWLKRYLRSQGLVASQAAR